MHRAVLCIGSNVEKATELIRQAVDCLSRRGTDVTARSEVYSVNLPYYNCVVGIVTDLDKDALVSLSKEIETDMGRTKAMKAIAMVPIDIDVVIFDDETLRPADYAAEYFKRGFSCVEG